MTAVGSAEVVAAGPARERRGFAMRADGRGLELVAPLFVFFAIFVLAPQVLLALSSLSGVSGGWSLATYARALGDPLTLQTLFATLRLGVAVTLLTVVVAFPFAMALAFGPPRLQGVLIALVVLPLLTSTIVRTFAWLVILGRQGPINEVLIATGLVDAPLQMLFSEPAVVVALVQIELPLMVMALAASLLRVDRSLLLASRSLGAGRWRTFRRVVLPLSVPGLLSGCILVFASAVGAFVSQTVIGGGRRLYMPYYIYQQSILLQDWTFAAVLALVLLASVFAIVLALSALGRRSRGFVHG